MTEDSCWSLFLHVALPSRARRRWLPLRALRTQLEGSFLSTLVLRIRMLHARFVPAASMLYRSNGTRGLTLGEPDVPGVWNPKSLLRQVVGRRALRPMTLA